MSSEVFLPDDPVDTRACPFCGETIKQIARKCRHCGELLGDPNSPGLFRDGKKLVVSRTAPMPPLCIKTGEPTDRYLTRELRWHHPLVYVLLLTGVIPYLIAALMVQKKQRVRIYLTPERIKSRRIGLAIATVAALGGVTAFIAGIIQMEQEESLGALLVAGGLLAFVIGLILALVYSNPVRAARIDDDHLWLKGAGQPFLATLPDWPGK